MSAVRSLVAFEEGAVGPSKDCAYEGPVIKAITGYPISMEGKSAACAHFSHMGNIAMAVTDLWSNESVQNVKLLSGFAPEVFTEVLTYDCRLLNESLDDGSENVVKSLLVKSDEFKSVHALIISPESSYKIAEAIVEEKSDFNRTRSAGLVACEIIREAVQENRLSLPKREINYLDRFEAEFDDCPSEEVVLQKAYPEFKNLVILSEYGL
jgi:methanol--5-hydroxybenzimidazolylcobamide Co-methyltransferase